MTNSFDTPEGNFRGHARQSVWTEAYDPELTEVGPGTPCGEYLRRYWLPVAMTDQVGDLPYRIRILGEDLILFREKGEGKLGLTHLHCAHRNMSLEFGIVEEGGIRCSYHGWKYALDGTILETPCEPPASQVKSRTCLGAYPVIEYKGLAFAYLGPPEHRPPFPVMDTFDEEGDEMIPYFITSPCNWLQVMENAWDPFHVVYLAHAGGPQPVHRRLCRNADDRVSRKCRRGISIPTYGGWRTSSGCGSTITCCPVSLRTVAIFRCQMRRATSGAAGCRAGSRRSMTPRHDGDRLAAFPRGRRSEGADRHKSQVGFGMTDFYGQGPDRDYEQRQRDPGDYDAWVSQGPINVHGRENLGFTDRGVAKARRLLRDAIRSVKAGEPARQPTDRFDGVIPTYGGDTMLRIPLQEGRDDGAVLKEISQEVAAIYMLG